MPAPINQDQHADIEKMRHHHRFAVCERPSLTDRLDGALPHATRVRPGLVAAASHTSRPEREGLAGHRESIGRAAPRKPGTSKESSEKRRDAVVRIATSRFILAAIARQRIVDFRFASVRLLPWFKGYPLCHEKNGTVICGN
jgi:hypothetical protein